VRRHRLGRQATNKGEPRGATIHQPQRPCSSPYRHQSGLGPRRVSRGRAQPGWPAIRQAASLPCAIGPALITAASQVVRFMLTHPLPQKAPAHHWPYIWWTDSRRCREPTTAIGPLVVRFMLTYPQPQKAPAHH
jgi:hypothetical protein